MWITSVWPLTRCRCAAGTQLSPWALRASPLLLARSHLRRLFPDLSRVDDEFERVGILVLLHQLQVYKPFGIRYGRAALEPISGRFKQRGCEFILAVCGQAFHRLDQLSFRHAEAVNQEFCVVCTGEMFEAL